MPQVDGKTIKQRAAWLREEGDKALERYLSAQLGVDHDVLMESETRGRTPQFTPVSLCASARSGEIITARMTGLGRGILEGTPLP